MRIWIFLCFALLAGTASAAERLVPDHVLAAIEDDGPTLPRGFAPGERKRFVLPDLSKMPRVPPAGDPRALAEYEENEGLLIRWGDQNAVLTEMTVAVTTLDRSGRMFIVVSDASQQASASSTLGNAGADLSRVEFIVAPSNSVWMRDYGPRYVTLGSQRGIIDHTYNRPRANDNLIPDTIASAWGEAEYDMPLVHGGGNFHLFANREAFMTSLILNENPGLSAQDVSDLYLEYQGLELTIVDPFPSSYDSTQHIDMWMLPASNRRIIIGEYAASQGGGVPRQVTESTTALLQSRGYEVLRTPGWRSGGAHYTYTNAVIVNNLVMMCSFNGYETQNQQARGVFEAAFPGKTIYAVDCSTIIGFAGAIHCIVMHVPDERAVSRVFRARFEFDD